jgi:hypothetical protein
MASEEAFRALEEKVDRFTRQLNLAEEKHAVRTLHFMYGK